MYVWNHNTRILDDAECDAVIQGKNTQKTIN